MWKDQVCLLLLQKSVIPTCRELGIGIVPYSPLGRGFLTGTITSLNNLQCAPLTPSCLYIRMLVQSDLILDSDILRGLEKRRFTV